MEEACAFINDGLTKVFRPVIYFNFNKLMIFRTVLIVALIFILVPKLEAQDLTQKAKDFLTSLEPELKSRTLFTLDNPERYNMNYVPIDRKGPTFHDFDEKQKQLALALLKASLSEQGFQKTSQIMKLENVLRVIEKNKRLKADGNPVRDPLDYHFCIFGNPSESDYWGWRFEGHHISLNFTSTSGAIISSTPSFMGTNPAVVQQKGFESQEVLKAEAALGFQLVNALTESQKQIAVISKEAPSDIITGTDRKVQHIEPKGLYYQDLSDDQKGLFRKLLDVYIGNYEREFAKELRAKIEKSGLENFSFAWAGSLEPGKGHYYRVQGPMLLIEYDNTQNNANHAHAVVRDFTNDYAEDILKEHYQKHH